MIFISFSMLLCGFYDMYVFQYAPGWILWCLCLSVCSRMDFMIFMSFRMLLDEFYIYRFLYTHAHFFDWPRSICSWMNVIIFMSFSMLLYECYNVYVFQCTPGWNLWYICFSICSLMKLYLCLSVCSLMKCMIFMSFSILLGEIYDINVFQSAPGWTV